MAKKIPVASVKKNKKPDASPAQIDRLVKQGDLNGALALAQTAVLSAPNSATANNNLGFVLAQCGRAAEGLSYYERAAQLDPSDPETLNSILRLRFDLKTLTDAVVASALARFPRHVKLLTLAASHYGREGDREKSEQYFKQALAVNEKSAETHYHYGQLLRLRKSNAAAAEQFLRAHELEPQTPRYLLETALAYSLCGNTQLADDYAQKAAKLAPKDYHCYAVLGHIWAKADVTKALFYFDHALELAPDTANEIYGFKALALETAGKFEEAEACFRQSIARDPTGAANHTMNLANVLVKQARIPEVMEALAQTLRLDPQHSLAMNNILLYAHYAPTASREDLWTLFRDYDRKFAAPLWNKNRVFPNVRDPRRKLRVGFMSADLRTHSVAFFTEPVLRAHDREQFEFFAYANQARNDQYTELLKTYVENWRDIFSISDAEAEKLIRDDQIDILIDLTGHTANNRILLFARKPAPVQVEWLGFPDTTGLSAMDYRIADEFTDPPRCDRFSSEKVVRLPGGFHCYCPFPNAPGIVPLPKLKNGYLTFGSFNNYAKTSTEIAALWVEILNAVPDSKLYLKSHGLDDAAVQARVRERFAKLGLAPERLLIETRKSSIYAHYMCYNQIDVALDTWPYNGTTTTFEALWMGAPVVTLTGETHASRVGASLLVNCGLEALIAQSPAEYAQKAVGLANNDLERAKLRATMRERLWCSPLLSESWFVKKFETALRAMWREYCGETGATDQANLYAAITNEVGAYQVPDARRRDLEAAYQRINEMIAQAVEPAGQS
ncbi:MAG: tetratricopeptide repeat protein [Planctomycetota bacterium]|jgi:predicted O-linked N-acetylglucosamine transferase (SPINDLY family)|nr:tetratricopeptide repeat protein [Planctomycetota bacterium]